MAFLPSGLYAPTSSIALFNAATEHEQQSRGLAASLPSDAALKRGMPMTAYAPVEQKKIALYSRVG